MTADTLYLPKDYQSKLDIRETEQAIKLVRDTFQTLLAQRLRLQRISAPLFVDPQTGLNDNLSGVERPVAFDIPDANINVEIVQSLAKWKRLALKRYGFMPGEGLYTDMDAIRRDEQLDNLHSVYVDQWDWEKVITRAQRTMETLQQTVRAIVSCIDDTQQAVYKAFACLVPFINPEVTFISAQQLEDRYPHLSAKEREHEICREYGTVFVTQIGGALQSGKPHDSRSPDYDDWSLNGDLLVWYPVLDRSVELSSMGIRVDEQTLHSQLSVAGCSDREKLAFHSALLAGELPLTIGGGIGQSRPCMLLLQKAHIGEVQVSVWPEQMLQTCQAHNITLL